MREVTSVAFERSGSVVLHKIPIPFLAPVLLLNEEYFDSFDYRSSDIA